MNNGAQRKVFSAQRSGASKVTKLDAVAVKGGAAFAAVPRNDEEIDEVIDKAEALLDDIKSLRQAKASGGRSAGGADIRQIDGGVRDVRIEIARMVREIGQAKREIAAIKHPMANENQVQTASQHLEEIVSMTESATNEIITGVDAIDDILKQIRADPNASEDVQEHVDAASHHLVKIVETCGFQDLTGQRIAQVVKVLRLIEHRVIAMIDIWGLDAFRDLPVAEEERSEADSLLNGPALNGQGLSQEDVDALFD